MKALVDSCVPRSVATALRAAGHDVVFVAEWERDPGDEDILAAAARDRRVLITLDRDFGELAIAQGLPHAGMIRLVALTPSEAARSTCDVFDRFRDSLDRGAILTVSPGRVRVRDAP